MKKYVFGFIAVAALQFYLAFTYTGVTVLRGTLFTISYFALSAVLHFFLYQRIKGNKEIDIGILTNAAIDIGSILKFISWIPLGLVAFDQSIFYMFIIPTIHEAYDIIYVMMIHRRRFTVNQVQFVLQHHLISPLLRTTYAVFVYVFVAKSHHQFYFGLALLMYSCSIFLIAPTACEPFLFGSSYTKGRAHFRTVCFSLARFSHFGIYAWCMSAMLSSHSASWLMGAATVMFLLVEYHSVVNGLPRIFDVWRKIELDSYGVPS